MGIAHSLTPIKLLQITLTLLLCSFLLLEMEMDSLKGFRFVPTNEEIIQLLKKKRSDPDFSVHTIKEINIYSCEPWELPDYSEIQSAEEVWYFFCEPCYKYAKSKRAHRRTSAGYWKITSTVSDVKAKNSDVIASKRILSFYHSHASKRVKTEWVMHEFYVEDDDPLYKKDFVMCRIERKRDNKPRLSTCDDGQSIQNLAFMTSYSRNHVAKNASPELQLPPNHSSISHSRNHVAENASPKSQLPPNHSSISHSRNHVAENASPESQLPPNHSSISHSRNHVAENASPESQLPPNHSSISHSRNHVAENASPESQLPPNHNSISHSRNHVAENISAEFQLASSHNFISYRNEVTENVSPELQFLPNQNLELEVLLNQYLTSHSIIHVSGNTFQAEPLQVAELNAHDCFNGQNNASFSPLQSQIYPEQEVSVDRRAFEKEYYWEENGQTLSPGFNSWKLDGGVYGEDSSEKDTETADAWVNELFVNEVDSSLC